MPGKGVALYGYFGHGNLGDEALREAWIRALSPDFEVRTLAPPRLPKGKGPWLFCGGILQDRTSLRSLLFYVAAIRLAARGGPVGLVAVGCELSSPLGRRLVRGVLRKAGFVSARDEEGLRQLSALGGDVRPARDPVLAWPPPPRGGSGPILVNLVPSLPRTVCKEVLQKARDLAEKLGSPLQGLVMAPEDARALGGLPLLRPTTPKEALKAIASSPLLVGARLHALELALVAGTPFVPLPYSAKVEGFLSLVERDLPARVPRTPDRPEEALSPSLREGLLRARARLAEEAQKGIEDVRNWLRSLA
ncbi:MAG: Polysaccharide pyruvyl transferase CsaB [Acetothermia bacterium 64_32]|nr:MAG: Polysaccharide pyruvyl transferase CsaB [Acetothermia bacterium 64_32]